MDMQSSLMTGNEISVTNQTTITVDAPVVTLINVFEVAPERQAELVEILERATQDVMRHLPGFVSANIHTSLDGGRVANYAQWRSVEDFQAMLGNANAQVHMREATAVAKSSPVLYRVHSVHR
jgi:antibiotic biosynthesis monooxygenase (ABM) superfamily enzyme